MSNAHQAHVAHVEAVVIRDLREVPPRALEPYPEVRAEALERARRLTDRAALSGEEVQR